MHQFVAGAGVNAMVIWPRLRSTNLTSEQRIALPLKLLLFLIFGGDVVDDKTIENLRRSAQESLQKILDDVMHGTCDREQAKVRMRAIEELLSEAEFENAIEKLGTL